MSIVIDRRVFRRLTEDDESWNQTIVVECDDTAIAIQALRAVADRAMHMGRGGREYSDEELAELEDRVDTPSNAIVSVGRDELPQLYVDCKGMVGGRRSTGLRRALKEELDRREIEVARVAPSPEELEVATARAEADAREASPEPPDWIQFADGSPPGFPPELELPGATVWQRTAGPYSIRHPSGPLTSSGGWMSGIASLDTHGYEDAVWSAYGALIAAGCEGAHPPGYVRSIDNRSMAFAALRYLALDVCVICLKLRGARGKPRDLRNRPEESLVMVGVLQPREPVPSDLRSLLHQFELRPDTPPSGSRA